MIHRRSVLTAALLAPLIAGCGRATAQADTPPPAPDAWADFDDELRRLTAAGQFRGAVLVADGDRTLIRGGYGAADEAAGRPVTPATPSCVGSMGKMFTAVAVAQLVERGALAFTDTLGAHLPGFPPEVAGTVTLHHLLTHTSGMGDIFDGGPVTEANHTIAALVERIRDAPLQFAPGSAFGYSNAGFVVLGAVIERVAGRPYADHVRERIFAPAGMADTAVRTYRPVDVPDMAHPYVLVGPDGQQLGPSPQPSAAPAGSQLRDEAGVLQGGSPAGGAISTVGDMTAFARALVGHRLLGPEITDTVLTGKSAVTMPGPGPGPGPGPRKGTPVEPPRYGYGFMEQRVNGVRIVGHNGGTPGYEAQLDIYPDTGHSVVVLANQDQVMGPVVRRSEELLTG